MVEDERLFDVLMQRMDSQDKDLGEIKAHVQKTNGRVTALEQWKSRAAGAAAVLTVLATALLAHALG